MADQVNLKGRFKFTYKTIEDWITNDPVLMEGEFGFTVVEVSSTDKKGVKNPPAVLMKVGDGTHQWSELSFVSGLAADVSSWAKSDTKPTYSASEITDLTTFINSTITDTDTQYRINKTTSTLGFGESIPVYQLQSKAKNATTWTNVTGGSITYIDEFDNLFQMKTSYEEFLEKYFDGRMDLMDELETSDTYDLVHAINSVLNDSHLILKTYDTPESGQFMTYSFIQGIREIGKINIPKDLVVQSGTVETVTEAGKPYANAKVGDKYIKLVIANQTEPIYIPANSLVDVYTAAGNAAEVQLSISDENVISATIVNGSITKTKLATAVQTSLGKADSALQEVTTPTGSGLKVSNKNSIEIDDTVTFVFDCNIF